MISKVSGNFCWYIIVDYWKFWFESGLVAGINGYVGDYGCFIVYVGWF